MRLIRNCALFVLGGVGYVSLELLWRGWSHVSMFFAGGTCFLLLGRLAKKKLPLPLRGFLGAGVITGVEFVTGLLCNAHYQVWDYRAVPLNFMGQICLPFTALWVPISMGAMILYNAIVPQN